MYVVVTCSVEGIAAAILGSISDKYGRNKFLILAYLLDVGQYIFLLFWIPTVENSWIIYLIAIIDGLVDAIILLSVQG